MTMPWNATYRALKALKENGRRLILVTGRELRDLQKVFPGHGKFDRIVTENGAVIYDPATQRERTLAPLPPAHFVEVLKQRKVKPLSVGRCIVATWEPNEKIILEIIRDLGLELQMISGGAVMVLPAGINKAAGLLPRCGYAAFLPQHRGRGRCRERLRVPQGLRLLGGRCQCPARPQRSCRYCPSTWSAAPASSN